MKGCSAPARARCGRTGRSETSGGVAAPSKRNRRIRVSHSHGRRTNPATAVRARGSNSQWSTGMLLRRFPTDESARSSDELLRKEVIQPHLPVRLPCYDFTPIADPTFDGSFLAVRPPASGVTNFRGVTGGVYKARERIHPGVADPGLLATPTSWSRVADSNPN